MLRFFLIPLVLSVLWFAYLQFNNWTIQQGKKGFIYILVATLFMIAFFTLMLFLTR